MIVRDCGALLGGLTPSAWLCVPPGVNREEVKDLLLQWSGGWVGDGVIPLEGLALRVFTRLSERSFEGEESVEKKTVSLASPSTRREVLRLLMKNSTLLDRFPELKRMKRQSNFIHRLDKAIQSARMGFAHTEEKEIQDRVLQEKLGWIRPLSVEVNQLCTAYETLLQHYGWMDLPLLLLRATECLQNSGDLTREAASSLLGLPTKGYLLAAKGRKVEAREQAFWEELGRFLGESVASVEPFQASSDAPKEWGWERWHTWEDAAEALADELGKIRDHGGRLDSVAVVFPDQPDQRRSLTRVLRERSLSLAEPRDPTAVLMDERFKTLSLTLQTVTSRFEREKVIAYLRAKMGKLADFPRWTRLIQENGISSGLGAYQIPGLEPVYAELSRMDQVFGSRLTFKDFRSRWNDEVRSWFSREPQSLWVLKVVESILDSMEKDVLQIRELHRRAPVRFWWETFRERLEEAAPPPAPLRPRDGVMLYRLGQWPVRTFQKVYLLGLDDRYLDGSGSGDYWRGERERETLAQEFSIRSPAGVREERKGLLNAWREASQESPLLVMSAQFDWKGSEYGQLLSSFRELGWVDPVDERAPVDRGAHPRWIHGYAPARRVRNLPLRLGPPVRTGRESSEKAELGVSAIESFSRCGFVGLAQARWKLKDLKQASPEIWNEVKGMILQEAINEILLAYQRTGTLALDADSALDLAWKKQFPQGLIRSPRFVAQSKREMRPAVAKFLEVEREERARVNLKIRSLDQESLIYETPEARLKGRPDQIEETADGAWFIKDYKASSASTLPTAVEMLEKGYRLQLPIYSLAALQMGAPEVHGIQFIALDAKGDRNRGVFFKKFNGKGEGKLTAHGGAVKSVLADEPSAVWEKAREQVDQAVRLYVEGIFEARPRRTTECYNCRFQGVCQKARHLEEDATGTESASGEDQG